jgi:hypothetical protein
MAAHATSRTGRILIEDGAVTHALTHAPHPVQPSPTTGLPRASSVNADSPTGHTRAHTPHETSRKVMHRSVSMSIDASCNPNQPACGGSSASVGQTVAHGTSAHMMHAVMAG